MERPRAIWTREGARGFSGGSLCLHQVVSGCGWVASGRTVHGLAEDGVLVQNLGTAHEVRAGRAPVLSLEFPPALAGTERFAEHLTPRDYGVDRAVSRILTGAPGAWEEAMAALVQARTHPSQNYHLADRPEDDPHLARVMGRVRGFVLSRLEGPLSLAMVAEAAAFSEFHFHRLFLRWHGTTPSRYIQEERVRRACRRLILADEAVAEVAGACGYRSPTSFVRAFRGITGFSPSDFREAKRSLRSELAFFARALQSCSSGR